MAVWKDGVTSGHLYNWYLDLKPSAITLHRIKTGKRIEEPSLVAARVKKVECAGQDPYTEDSFLITQFLAVGQAALEYQDSRDVMVFSPFRHGQIAHYFAVEYMIKAMLKQVMPKFPLLKPVLCIRVQQQTTEVEERALIDAGLMAGARKVFLYKQPLPVLLQIAQNTQFPNLKNAYVLHIEPQETDPS